MESKVAKLVRIAILVFLAFILISAASAQTLTVLYSFTGKQDGSEPSAELVLGKNGNLYGTTSYGGSTTNCQYGCGTVFEVTPSGDERVLHAFTGGDGAYPDGKLVFDANGNLYGTTPFGGDLHCVLGTQPGCGTVFKIAPSGKETVLHRFTGKTDGGMPMGWLVFDPGQNMYGVTFAGGAAGLGTIFEITPTGKESTLHVFTGPDGAHPEAGLVFDNVGNLYGTTAAGGGYNTDAGAVFKLTPAGKESVLHGFIFTFTSTDGYQPRASVAFDKYGDLYGTTVYGGDRKCPGTPGWGCGVIFKITPSGTGTESVLYAFTGSADAGPDGLCPNVAVVLDANGNLYGTTNQGGAYGQGTVFKVTPAGKETVLYSFGGSADDGLQPAASLIFDAQGNLYGTTAGGGIYGYGTVFKLVP